MKHLSIAVIALMGLRDGYAFAPQVNLKKAFIPRSLEAMSSDATFFEELERKCRMSVLSCMVGVSLVGLPIGGGVGIVLPAFADETTIEKVDSSPSSQPTSLLESGDAVVPTNAPKTVIQEAGNLIDKYYLDKTYNGQVSEASGHNFCDRDKNLTL